MDLTFRPVDADQHYYEKIDSCTRHLDPKFKDRGIQIVEQGTHKLLLAGDRMNPGDTQFARMRRDANSREMLRV